MTGPGTPPGGEANEPDPDDVPTSKLRILLLCPTCEGRKQVYVSMHRKGETFDGRAWDEHVLTYCPTCIGRGSVTGPHYRELMAAKEAGR